MPLTSPPAMCPGTPVVQDVPIGTILWRLHAGGRSAAAMNPTPRPSPLARIRGRLLSAVEVITPLPVVVTHGAALTHLGQDVWLTKSPAADYGMTRRRAAAIRARVPDAVGIVYRCRHDENLRAWLLTSAPNVLDHPALRVLGGSLALDTPPGRAYLRPVLARYHAGLSSA